MKRKKYYQKQAANNTVSIGILSETDKTVLKYTAGFVIGGILIYYGYTKVNNYFKDIREEKYAVASSVDGTAENLAAKFREAFEYFSFAGNTDKTLALNTLAQVKTKAMWFLVQEAYKKWYNENLMTRMRDEFGDYFFNVGGSMRDVEAIISQFI